MEVPFTLSMPDAPWTVTLPLTCTYGASGSEEDGRVVAPLTVRLVVAKLASNVPVPVISVPATCQPPSVSTTAVLSANEPPMCTATPAPLVTRALDGASEVLPVTITLPATTFGPAPLNTRWRTPCPATGAV